MKPQQHLVETIIFSVYHVIVRHTKIIKGLLKDRKILMFKVIFRGEKLTESFRFFVKEYWTRANSPEETPIAQILIQRAHTARRLPGEFLGKGCFIKGEGSNKTSYRSQLYNIWKTELGTHLQNLWPISVYLTMFKQR